MRSFFLTIAQALGIVLLADFLAGIIHWFEDAYCDAETPVLGPLLIRPNIVHHHYPRFFTRLSWWQSSWELVLVGAGVVGLAAWCGVLSWQVWLFVAISVNANQIHKWSHQTRKENGPVVSFFQDIRVLQTPRHHALHHTDPKNTFYCPVTNLVNPVLERTRFWPRLEAVIETTLGVRRREDTSVRGHGPGPAWLSAYRPVPAHAPATPAPGAAAVAVRPTTPAPACARDCARCPHRCAK